MRQRGLSEVAAKEFHLGLALNGWRHLRDFFEKKKVPLNLVEKAGLVIRGERGEYYDRFRGRLIFPIENVTGQVIAFGGRASGDEKPKYLNSPESPVYVKGRNLFALSKARDAIRNREFVVLVEGYFDALSLWNAGIKNVVATLGTALTREHLELIRRFTSNIVVIFDPDEGGRSALERSLVLFLEEKFNAKVVILPENLDPDDYIKKYGPEGMGRMISGAKSMVDHYIENAIGGKRGFEEDLGAFRKAVAFISHIEDMVQRNLFVKRVSEKLGVDEAMLKAEVTRSLQGGQKRRFHGMSSPQSGGLPKNELESDPVEMTLIHLLIEFPDKISQVLEEGIFEFVLNQDLKRLGLELKDRYHDKLVITDLIEVIGSQWLRENILKLTVSDNPFGKDVSDEVLSDTIVKIKKKWFKARA